MADATNISSVPFDGAEVWATLTPSMQARVGALALEAAVGRAVAEHAFDPASRAGMEAERNALDALQEAVLGMDGLSDKAWVETANWGASVVELFRLPSVLGQACHACGCSERDPCDEGCGWHDAVTCTACAVPVQANLSGDTL
ncbi:hypothetical protein [Methylobacterium gregans]|uniref:Uncharacterized protein n=1 Tax=Methylobacterium gregans TaxID=374424 RepID=A0AA37HPG1_9HYPH|nr:hypothetical protein [Methylobacterium gregans]MDQ0522424.1 hypothetical protein [Methylobacterium gregans]GJD79572.1 hypothetical protein NBEOAGPD_2801 [Methylobacterium gregans]GLS55170.1 hypothetical protein GCM10007886_33540 [Methylobacterium gregans]